MNISIRANFKNFCTSKGANPDDDFDPDLWDEYEHLKNGGFICPHCGDTEGTITKYIRLPEETVEHPDHEVCSNCNRRLE